MRRTSKAVLIIILTVFLLPFLTFPSRAESLSEEPSERPVSGWLASEQWKTAGESQLALAGILQSDGCLIITAGYPEEWSEGEQVSFTDYFNDEYQGAFYRLYRDGFSGMDDDARKAVRSIITTACWQAGQSVSLNFSDMPDLVEASISFINADQPAGTGMFAGDEHLESVTLNLQGLHDASYMFANCYALKNADLSRLDTSEVGSMNSMFLNCHSLEELDLSSFDCSALEDCDEMLAFCTSLRKLDISSFDTSILPVGRGIFRYDYALSEIAIGENWGNGWFADDEDPNANALPEGYWTNGLLTLESAQLAADYWDNRSSWQGTWRRMMAPLVPVMSTQGMLVSWLAVDGAENYDVYLDYELIGSTDQTSFLIPGLQMGEQTSVIVETQASETVYRCESWPVFNPFADVIYPTEHFWQTAWAYNNGIVVGTSNTTYSPQNKCTRAQFCVMLWKMFGKPETDMSQQPFTDIASQTVNTRKAILWCASQGIIKGRDGRFNPRGNITRSQLLIMLYKLADTPAVDGLNCPFEDLGTLTSNSRNAVIWAYNYGISEGLTSSLFGPDEKGTRQQLTGMLYGYDELFGITDQ